MKVKDLISVLPAPTQIQLPEAVADKNVSLLTADSRQVIEGSVYVAIRGLQFDGHDFLDAVIQKKPVFIILQKDAHFQSKEIPILRVDNTRETLDLLASRYYGDPSHRLYVFGVTGTNGKTSSCYMMEQIMNSMGFPCGVIGTIDHHLGDTKWESAVTTPDSLQLQHRLQEMKEAGAKAIAMEVSSHALSQHRADSVQFNTVLFTNLTQDHLDYHQTMEKYFLSKQRLFTDLMRKSHKFPQFAIVNVDDYWGRRLRVAAHVGLWTFGQSLRADFRYEIRSMNFEKTQFELDCPFGNFDATLPMCGIHNVTNAVGCLAAAASLGVPLPIAIQALENFKGVPGRLQAVPNRRGVHVFVDYAHSPDALEKVLTTLKSIRDQNHPQSRILAVFGCGGDRDKGKRPLMARAAELAADFVCVTSDNPRTENPSDIIKDVVGGFHQNQYRIQEDRALAIRETIAQAQPGDVVIIAGKGHEKYQIIGDKKIVFDDVLVAEEASAL